MRYAPLLFLILVAAHPGPRLGGGMGDHFSRHHAMPSSWHMRPRDGSSPSDFGRRFAHVEAAMVAREQARVGHVELGNGARVGVGFVGGRHLGFRLKAPF